MVKGLERKNINGWTFFVFPVTKNIYRGDSSQYGKPVPQLRSYEYFSNKEVASRYGLVSKWHPKRILYLLSMDNLQNLDRLYNESPDDVKYAITSSFGYSPITRRIQRVSEVSNDRKILDYLCKQGLDGYAHPKIASETEKPFHSEVAICNPVTVLEFEKYEESNKDIIERQMEQDRLIRLAEDDKRRRQDALSRRRIQRREYEDDDDDIYKGKVKKSSRNIYDDDELDIGTRGRVLFSPPRGPLF